VGQQRAPGQRAGLTRARVLEAARELLAERGLEAVSMRGLAARLEVTPNALYSHVANKTALIDDVLDDVLAEVRAPDPETAEPAAGLHALMSSTYEVLLAHPDLVPLYLARRGARGPEAQQLGAVMLALLARVEITGARAREALRVLIVYTIGFAAFAVRPPLEIGPAVGPPGEELAANFERGLRWLLAGIGVPD
jgi:TetR/AcrR family transcriptional regulator, tetracycline repressor protein